MARLTAPLGGADAHGQLGKSIVYQGTTAKRYKYPRVQYNAAQLDQQDKFQSVTKTFGEMGAWARGVMQVLFLDNWFGKLLEYTMARWDEAAAIYAGFDVPGKATWVNNAPYSETKIEVGRTFFVCAYAVAQKIIEANYTDFDLVEPDEDTGADAASWWSRGIAPAFCAGKFDDDHPDINYQAPLEWSLLGGPALYGGYEHLSASNGSPSVDFWFYGRKITLVHSMLSTGTAMRVNVDAYSPVIVAQQASPSQHQIEWTSDLYPMGLHRVWIHRDGAEGGYTLDAIQVSE